MRINHMELTFAEGELSSSLKQQINDFYQAVFGWSTLEIDIVGQQALLIMIDEEVSQFILCAESPKPISAPGYDHLGLLFDSREEVDAVLHKCKQLQAKNPAIQIKEYDDLIQGPTTTHAFYVKHLLPIWFDVQFIEYESGSEPAKQWHYG